MKLRKMGQKFEWDVTPIGFGAMRLPWKKFLFFKKFRINEEESIRIIRYAIDNGINYVDTAYTYMNSKSEIVVGKALKDGYREKVHVVTKLPIWKVKTQDDFDKYLNEQLEKLQIECLDIYLFHALNKKRFATLKKLNLIEKMEEAKKAGKIKHYGFSFHDNLDVFKEIIDYHDWDVCQIQYNYMDAAANFQAGTEGLKYAAEKGIAVIIMEPIRGGKLVNPPSEILNIMNRSETKRTPVDWALQFLWNKPEVSCVLSGMGNTKMIDENIESAKNSGINSLSDEDNKILNEIGNIYRKFILIPCTKCNYCLEECENGVNIPEIFDIINEYSKDKNLKKANKRYNKLVKDSSKSDKNNPNGGPNQCVKCGKCIQQCPQGIDIPSMLEKVESIFEQKIPLSEAFGVKSNT